MRTLQFGDLMRSHVVRREDNVEAVYDKFYDLWKHYLQLDHQIIHNDDGSWRRLNQELTELMDIFLQILRVQNFEIRITDEISLHNVWM